MELKTGIVLIHVLVQIGERSLDRSKIPSKARVLNWCEPERRNE